MFHKHAFDFKRSDAIARRFDDVVGAPDKPIIAVFVAPRRVARVIKSVVHYRFCRFFVVVISAEKSDGCAFRNIDADFAFFAVCGKSAVGGNQFDFILRARHTHAAGFRVHMKKVCKRQRRFGLSEAFHKFDARKAQKLFIYLGIQRFAGDRRVFYAGNVVL